MKQAWFALFAVAALISFASASFLYNPAVIVKQTPLQYYYGGEDFNFTPDDVTVTDSNAIKSGDGFKWSLNFTLPSNNFKLKFSVDGKSITEKEKDKSFIIENKILLDFSDAIASGLTVKLNANKLEVSGWSNTLVGTIVELDPLVTQTTTAGTLYNTNQRKFLVNPKDNSLWTSFVGNSSCYVAKSTNVGASWTLTNVSRGNTDEFCSIDVDDYGNVWSYYGSDTIAQSLYGRVFGWNGAGWTLGAAWNITSYIGNPVLKTCGNTVGVFYEEAPTAKACFKKCLNIQNGACNTTSTAWNSTNNTLDSYCSINGSNIMANPALDCFNGDFVAVTAQTPPALTQLAFGKKLTTGDYVWNNDAFPFSYGAPALTDMPSLAHNSTTLYLVGKTVYAGDNEIYFKQCWAGTGCNVTSNWTEDILLSTIGGDSGVFGAQVGELNYSPVVAWVESVGGNYAILGKWFNKTSNAWSGLQLLAIATSKDLRWPHIPSNATNATNYTFVFLNNTNQEVWSSQYDWTLSGTLSMNAFDEQTNAPITFTALFYNASGNTVNYTDVTYVLNYTAFFPQGLNTIYVSNSTQYYPRYYFANITAGIANSITAYLLNSSATVLAVRFHIRTGLGSTIPIPNANVLVQRNIGGVIKTVNEMHSDFNGDALVYMEAGVPYYLTVTASGYGTFFGTINPSTTDYPITLYGSSGGANGTVNVTPFMPSVLDDVYWWLSPFSNIINESANITFYVNSTGDNLTYYGMAVYNETDGLVTPFLLSFQNITTSSLGGKIYYFFNNSLNSSSPMVNVSVWFSHSPPFVWNVTYYTHPPYHAIYGAIQTITETIKDSGMSKLWMALVVLFIAIFIGAFVARLNMFAGLIVVTAWLGYCAVVGILDIASVLPVVGSGDTVIHYGVLMIAATFVLVISMLYLEKRV